MYSKSVRMTALLALVLFGISPLGSGQQPAPTAVYGGQGGTPFSDIDIPAGARVFEVYVFSAEYVDAVQISYLLPDGRSISGQRHGGPGGRQNIFRLDTDEYITGLSGRCGKYIDSIRVHTNKRSSPAFGGRGGDRDYRVEIPSGNQGAGFTGRAGDYLDAIGLTYIPLTIRANDQSSIVGGGGGSAFSDLEIPAGARVSEVRIHSGDVIDSVQIVYTLENGSRFEGPSHGGRGGRSDIFRLERDEYVTGISGRCGIYIDSLAIVTNRRTSPRFGGRGGNRDYRLDAPSGNQVIGFSGRSGEFLDAIGINSAPLGKRIRNFERRRPRR
jgi:hypothetical protein